MLGESTIARRAGSDSKDMRRVGAVSILATQTEVLWYHLNVVRNEESWALNPLNHDVHFS